ncbi:MAG: GNAT family N-acetyltransferase [Saprospiraceae bacterium]|nr:GNAT family N-acetyltransferase [Saprospiraceae bacterium]
MIETLTTSHTTDLRSALKYIRCDHSLEAKLNLQPSSRKISTELKEALEQTILPNVADPNNKNHLYSTLWTAVLKEENLPVGDLCIIGEPNAAGEIEIGYGIYDEYKDRGYTTEIVSGLIRWAKRETRVLKVVASSCSQFRFFKSA